MPTASGACERPVGASRLENTGGITAPARQQRREPPELPSLLSWHGVPPSAIIRPSCPGPTAAADGCDAMIDPQALREALFDLRTPLRLVRRAGTVTLANGDEPLAGF